jgi:hypothetical protein
MPVGIPSCMTCARYHSTDDNGITCDAFPDRIPDLIWLEGDPHTAPVDGDGGKLYIEQYQPQHQTDGLAP